MRITEKLLEGLVESLNRVTGSPTKPYKHVGVPVSTENPLGYDLVPDPGHFQLQAQNGGFMLQRTKERGWEDVFNAGVMSKKDLHARISALIDGYQLAQDEQRKKQLRTFVIEETINYQVVARDETEAEALFLESDNPMDLFDGSVTERTVTLYEES